MMGLGLVNENEWWWLYCIIIAIITAMEFLFLPTSYLQHAEFAETTLNLSSVLPG